jgi:hypothetical protein
VGGMLDRMRIDGVNAEFGIFARMPSPGKCRAMSLGPVILASFRHRACGIIFVALQGV